MTDAPRLSLVEIGTYERDVTLRMPFRFGAVTMTQARQAFLCVRIRLEDGREGWGGAAELLAPKWFDKDPALSNDDNLWQLRASLVTAIHFYAASGPMTAFDLWRTNYPDQIAACEAVQMNALVASFGLALLDKAVLDALCRIENLSVFEAFAGNLPGIAANSIAPDLANFDVDAFVRSLRPEASIRARHTVGLIDPLAGSGSLGDTLPETLEEVVAAYDQRDFKIKLGGDPQADCARLEEIAAILDRIVDPYRVTLDGNEQYREKAALEMLLRFTAERPALARLRSSICFIEQPFPRDTTWQTNVADNSLDVPLLIDEADDSVDAFPRAIALGYRGVSSKSCKGLYKSILNAARCHTRNTGITTPLYFMSGEDLMVQGGLALQQDLALASLVGCRHVERNGHHYVDGMADAPAAEQRALQAAHSDLYHWAGDRIRVTVKGGSIALRSLSCHGFACAPLPDFNTMQPMPERE